MMRFFRRGRQRCEVLAAGPGAKAGPGGGVVAAGADVVGVLGGLDDPADVPGAERRGGGSRGGDRELVHLGSCYPGEFIIFR